MSPECLACSMLGVLSGVCTKGLSERLAALHPILCCKAVSTLQTASRLNFCLLNSQRRSELATANLWNSCQIIPPTFLIGRKTRGHRRRPAATHTCNWQNWASFTLGWLTPDAMQVLGVGEISESYRERKLLCCSQCCKKTCWRNIRVTSERPSCAAIAAVE